MNLRYHHLEQFQFLEDSFTRWKENEGNRKKFGEERLAGKTFDTLYLDQEIGRAYINDYTEWFTDGAVNVTLRRHRYPDLPSIDHTRDYVGEKAEHSEEFKQSYAESLIELLLSDPDTVVEISYAPDMICSSCQRKSPEDTEHGIHCHVELHNIQDFQWDRTLELLVNQNSSLLNYTQRKQTEDGPVVTTRIGLLRQPHFIHTLSESFDEEMSELYRRGGIEGLIRDMIFEIRGSPPIVYATEAYLQGERML